MELKSGKSKIAILIPYFGKLPAWFDYFAMSCSFNPEIDWHIYTDDSYQKSVLNNVFIHAFTLDEFNKLASHKTGFHVQVKYPYKLCDFKPLYGLIFSEFIKDYHFWGYGDLDLVYGNIRKFITDDLLEANDIISMHPEFVPGHFCIFRNNNQMNYLFRKIKNHQAILQSQQYFGFDEKIHFYKVFTNPSCLQFSKKGKIYFLLFRDRFISIFKKWVSIFIFGLSNAENGNSLAHPDFSSLVLNLAKNNKIKVGICQAYLCDFNYLKKRQKNWKFEWANGKLTETGTHVELIYFHFQLSKESKKFHIPEAQGSAGFLLTRNGFSPIK